MHPDLPERAQKAHDELVKLGASVDIGLGYGNHTAFILRWRNDDTFEIFAKYGDKVREEFDGSLNGLSIIGHGVREDVHAILEKHQLYWEWHDSSLIQVYKNHFFQRGYRDLEED